jgi:hypothetical protein
VDGSKGGGIGVGTRRMSEGFTSMDALMDRYKESFTWNALFEGLGCRSEN